MPTNNTKTFVKVIYKLCISYLLPTGKIWLIRYLINGSTTCHMKWFVIMNFTSNKCWVNTFNGGPRNPRRSVVEVLITLSTDKHFLAKVTCVVLTLQGREGEIGSVERLNKRVARTEPRRNGNYRPICVEYGTISDPFFLSIFVSLWNIFSHC